MSGLSLDSGGDHVVGEVARSTHLTSGDMRRHRGTWIQLHCGTKRGKGRSLQQKMVELTEECIIVWLYNLFRSTHTHMHAHTHTPTYLPQTEKNNINSVFKLGVAAPNLTGSSSHPLKISKYHSNTYWLYKCGIRSHREHTSHYNQRYTGAQGFPHSARSAWSELELWYMHMHKL